MIYDVLDGPHALAVIEQLCDLYAEVYAEPPYNEGPQHVATFADHFTDEVTRPGFSLVTATDHDVLAGAVHGWTMKAGRWFRNPLAEPPAEIKNAPKFAVIEWMVRKRYRGTGVGRQLLDRVLDNRPERYAILTSNPDSAARRIYDRLGWRFMSATRPSDLLPSMDVLVRDLGGNPL